MGSHSSVRRQWSNRDLLGPHRPTRDRRPSLARLTTPPEPRADPAVSAEVSI